MVSQEEELLEPVELDLARSRKLWALAQLGYLGVKQADHPDVTERGCFSRNWRTWKPKDWGRLEVQKVLWVMELWAHQQAELGG